MDPELRLLLMQAQAALQRGADPASVNKRLSSVTEGRFRSLEALQFALTSAEEEPTVDTATPDSPQTTGHAQFARVAASALTGDWYDEIAGAVAGLFGGDREAVTKREREHLANIRDSAPGVEFATRALVGLLPVGGAASLLGRVGGGVAGKALAGAAGAAAGGAVAASGGAEGGAGERMPAALGGAALAAPVGLLGGVAAGLTPRVKQALPFVRNRGAGVEAAETLSEASGIPFARPVRSQGGQRLIAEGRDLARRSVKEIDAALSQAAGAEKAGLRRGVVEGMIERLERGNDSALRLARQLAQPQHRDVLVRLLGGDEAATAVASVARRELDARAIAKVLRAAAYGGGGFVGYAVANRALSN